jgi:hypothetical protein
VTGPQLVLPLDVTDVGETRLYRLVLPFLPPSKNVYENWPVGWKASAKRKWVKTVGWACVQQDMPRGVDRVGLAATLVFPSRARRDPQNYAQALWHWVPDALVQCGVLVDDDEGRIQIPPNWGLKFAYDLRRGVPKDRRSRTVLAVTMRCRSV